MKTIKNRIARQAFVALCGVAAVTASGSAFAVCSKWSDGSHDIFAATITANGMSAWRPVSAWQAPSEDYTGGCSASMGGPTMTLTASAREVGTYRASAKEIYSIYDSGVPGLGYIVGFRGALRGGEFQAVRNGVPVSADSPRDQELAYTELRVRYIKTGDTTAGVYDTAPLVLGSLWVSDTTSKDYTVPMTINSASITVVHRPVCYPEPVTVRMGSVAKTLFDGKYSGGPERGFHVAINCEAFMGDVDYYLEGTESSPANDSERGIIEVSGGAVGVGLQMLRDTAGYPPIPLEQTQNFGTNRGGGRISRYFKARYVQTVDKAEDIVPGTANAAMRIVMDYP